MDKITILASKAPWARSIDLLICSSDSQRIVSQATSISFEDVPEGTLLEPTIHLRYEEAQTLMDELWNCGIKPSEMKDDALELKSTKYHLEDMRRIAFKYIEHDN